MFRKISSNCLISISSTGRLKKREAIFSTSIINLITLPFSLGQSITCPVMWNASLRRGKVDNIRRTMWKIDISKDGVAFNQCPIYLRWLNLSIFHSLGIRFLAFYLSFVILCQSFLIEEKWVRSQEKWEKVNCLKRVGEGKR